MVLFLICGVQCHATFLGANMIKASLFSNIYFNIASLVLVAITGTVLLSSPQKACAGATASLESAVCDPDIWRTMAHRAWIEAQREVEINQSIITRPDSVFELSCFDAFIAHSSKSAGAIFSGREDPAGANGQGDITATTVNGVVTAAVGQYLSLAGFSATDMGGGTITGLSYSFEPYNNGSGPSFASQCSKQAQVWAAFKCKNVGDLNALIFNHISQNDPRKVYSSGGGGSFHSCADVPSGGAQLYDSATVWANALSMLHSPTVAGTIATYFDPVETFSDMTSPTGACAGPIATGVQIVQSDGSTTAELICPNPGCAFDGTSACVR